MYQHSIPKDKKIKIAIVGCGKISKNHFASIQELANQFELVAVCDNHLENLEHMSKALNVKGYHDLDNLLTIHPELDVVTLCSPSGLHARQTIQIAKHGKHIVTEKPMAIHLADGIEMINACDAANVNLFVVKQVRYQPALQKLKHAIEQQRFGHIYLTNLNVFWTRPQSYYNQAKWRGTWEFDGGAFMNQASHYVDILHWLFGPVQCVQSMLSTLALNIETEDTGVLNLKWCSGMLGSMNVTLLTYPKNFETSLTVIGEKGTVKLGGLAANEIQHWEFAESTEEDEHFKNGITHEKLAPYFGHKCYYENVSKTLRGESHPDTDGREGLRSLEILAAIYLSARDNKLVKLPLDCTG